MKRTLILTAALVGLATAANAATMVLASDQATYNVGDTIVLTATGSGSDDPSDTTNGIFGRLFYDDPGSNVLTSNVTSSQTLHSNGAMMGTPWTGAGDGFVGASTVNLFSQVAGITAVSTNSSSNPMIATATLIATTAGTITTQWYVNPGDPGATYQYFALTNANDVTFTIIPEPTTAALLGLGLVGLVAGGRRRK